MAGNVAPHMVTDGLVLCLDAANPKSYSGTGTSITDLASSPLRFQLTNGVGYSTENNGVLVFDGVDGVVISNSRYIMVSGMSWSIWCKKSADGDLFSMLFSNTIPYLAYRGTGSGSNLNKFQASWLTTSGGTTTQRNLYTNNVYPINRWYNVVFTLLFDVPNLTTIGKLYVNGVFEISSSRPTDGLFQVGTTGRLILGNYDLVNYPFTGVLGPFLIYHKILSDQEILQNYNATKGRFGL